MPDTPELSVFDTGRGPAILLLHAFPLDSSQWDHQVAVLSGAYRCLRPDMWGCGSSAPHPEPMSVTFDAYVDAVVGELDRREIDTVVAVGSSMGGYTAYAMWRRAPQRIRALVLVSARPAADNESQAADRRRMAERALREGTDFIVEGMVQRLLAPRARAEVHIADPLRGRIHRCTRDGIAACQSAMAARPDSTPMLGHISVPTLVVAGDHDVVVGLGEAEALTATIPDAQLAVMAGVGHLPNLEDPPGFNTRLVRFLDELTSTADG